MNRRYFILTIGASTFTIIAGCSTSEEHVAKPTRTGKSGKPETGTKTKRSIEAAIASSRKQLTDALTTLNRANVVKESEIGVKIRNEFEAYRNTDEEAVLGPGGKADKTLESIRNRADGEQAETIEVLLRISAYIEEKWNEYTAIVRAFTAFGVTLSKVSNGDPETAKEAAKDATVLLSNASEYQSKATSTLQRIRKASGDPGIEAWHPEQEASEQESIGKMVHEMEPAFTGMREFVTGVTKSGRATTLIENGQYSKAMDSATSGRAHIDTATTHFRRALDRDVRHYTDLFTMLACQSSVFYDVLATLIDAIQAYQDGNPKKGEDLRAEFRTRLDREAEKCKPSQDTSIG